MERGLGALRYRLVLAATTAAIAGVLGLGCHHGASNTTGRATPSIEGCWSLEILAEDAQRDSVRSWLPRGTLPAVIELDTAQVDGDRQDDARVAHSWFDGRRESDPFSVWHRFAGDSIRVQRTGALSGLMLRLQAENGGLAGTVVSFTDVAQRDRSGRQQARIEAEPVDCPGG